MFLRAASALGPIKNNLHVAAAFQHVGRCRRSSPTSGDGVRLVRRSYHRNTALGLNRFLFDPCEIDPSDLTAATDGTPCGADGDTRRVDGDTGVSVSAPTVTLPKNDYRTIHAAKILGLLNGDTLRAGIVEDRDGGVSERPLAGLVTDRASVDWLPEGKIKKARPTKNGDPPGSLRITLHSLARPEGHAAADGAETEARTAPPPKPHVSLILAVPRPLGLSRLLPMISQLGVDHVVLAAARKVPKDYFGSHLLREPKELRRLLIEGLCQAGDVRIPKITVVKRLKPFLEDDLDDMFPTEGGGEGGDGAGWTRVIAHPERKGDGGGTVRRMREVVLASAAAPAAGAGDGPVVKNIVLAVGPEGGWDEPYELDMFRRCGFEQITLGTRILRTDVAVVSLLSLAHDSLCAARED